MIPIVFSTDHNYIMQTGVSLCSLLQSANDCRYDINIIIAENVTEADKDILCRQVAVFPGHKISFVKTDNEFEGWFEIRNISTATYYRLLIPWLLPQYDKVIYSDVDVIFRLSLKDIYDIDLVDYYFAAVHGAFFRYSKEAANYAISLGIEPKEYVNSGFLVINSQKQRADNLKKRILKFSGSKLTYQDQDIINVLCKGRIIPVSPKYCITPAFYEQCILKNPDIFEFYGNKKEIDEYLQGKKCILHYAGAKPWNSFVFAFSDWWNTYQSSIFYDEYYQLSQYNCILNSIHNPKLSLRRILGHIKRYLLQKI